MIIQSTNKKYYILASVVFGFIPAIFLMYYFDKKETEKIRNHINITLSSKLDLNVTSIFINRGWVEINDRYYTFEDSKGNIVNFNFRDLKRINSDILFPEISSPFTMIKNENNDTIFFFKNDKEYYKILSNY